MKREERDVSSRGRKVLVQNILHGRDACYGRGGVAVCDSGWIDWR